MMFTAEQVEKCADVIAGEVNASPEEAKDIARAVLTEIEEDWLAERSAQPVSWAPPNYVQIMKRNGLCMTCAKQPFPDYIPLYASPPAQPSEQPVATDREVALIWDALVADGWKPPATPSWAITDTVKWLASTRAQPQPDNGLPNNLPVWLDHDGIELVQIDGTAYAMEHVRDALKAALSSQPQPDNAALVDAVHFLIDRLDEYENEIADTGDYTMWFGHAAPALGRVRSLIAAALAKPDAQQGGLRYPTLGDIPSPDGEVAERLRTKLRNIYAKPDAQQAPDHSDELTFRLTGM